MNISSVGTILLSLYLVSVSAGCASRMPVCNGNLCGKKTTPDRAMFVRPELVTAEPMEVPTHGKITIIDFWEVSCKPCIRAMRKWEALWNKMDQKGSVMVGISLDDDVDTARKAVRDGTIQVTFPMLYDGEARVLDEIYAVGAARPVTVVVDEDGLVIFDSRGTPGNVVSAVKDLLDARGMLE